MNELIDSCKHVLENTSACKIDQSTGRRVGDRFHPVGILLDLMTATVVISTYDALNGENRENFSSSSPLKAIDTAYELLQRSHRS